MSKSKKLGLIAFLQIAVCFAIGWFVCGLHLSFNETIGYSLAGSLPVSVLAIWARAKVMDCGSDKNPGCSGPSCHQ